MSKKHNYTRPVRVADKSGDELLTFPADRHVVTPAQREIPNPTAALVVSQPSERAYLRAATVAQEQQQARARREALAILEREESRRDEIAHAPTSMEDLYVARRRPLGAPMATRIGSMPDPFAQQLWTAIAAALVEPALTLWDRVKLPLAFSAWSIGCFLLGRLA